MEPVTDQVTGQEEEKERDDRADRPGRADPRTQAPGPGTGEGDAARGAEAQLAAGGPSGRARQGDAAHRSDRVAAPAGDPRRREAGRGFPPGLAAPRAYGCSSRK